MTDCSKANISSAASAAAGVDACLQLPTELIGVFERAANPRDSRRSLVGRQEPRGQHLYALVHRDPVLYKNLYRYLVFRFATPAKLSRCTDQLLRWEKDFHGQNAAAALACWRLHLGSCEVLKLVVQSVQTPGFMAKFYDWYLPLKNRLRTMLRRSVPESAKASLGVAYGCWSTAYFLVTPFIGATFFYFDLLKDLTFTLLIYNSVHDLTQGNFSPSEFPFETAVVVGLFGSIITTQLIFVWISVYYSNVVFEMCEHSSSPAKTRFFRALSLLLAPLMPAFLLANHVYYVQQEYAQLRTLQTLGEGGGDGESDENTLANKLCLFRDIERTRYRSRLHRRVYSFFRVSAAVIQSFNMIAGVVVIVVVSGQLGRKMPLIDGVAEKIGDFLNLPHEESFISNLDIARDVVIVSCVLYSMLMIVSALVRYVYQCKNLNLVFGGKVCLTLYFVCHLTARLTMFIALFSTAEHTDVSKPRISLLPAAIIGFFIFVFHFLLIYWFKWRFVANFKDANSVERFIHVLANTLVAIPHMPWDVDVPTSDDANPKCSERRFSCPALDEVLEKKKHAPQLHQLRKTVSDLDDQAVAGASSPSSSFFTFPNVSAPLVQSVGDVREKIVDLWWEDPSRQIRAADVVARQKTDGVLRSMSAEMIDASVAELARDGFINKRLYIPQRTKREYFWLMIFHLFFSSLALIIEFVNGGTYTTGGLYYSWDVRLSSFALGLFFLLLYYYKYHALRDLTSESKCCSIMTAVPILCCLREQPPMTAAPVEEEMVKFFREPSAESEGTGGLHRTNEKETQTNNVEQAK